MVFFPQRKFINGLKDIDQQIWFSDGSWSQVARISINYSSGYLSMIGLIPKSYWEESICPCKILVAVCGLSTLKMMQDICSFPPFTVACWEKLNITRLNLVDLCGGTDRIKPRSCAPATFGSQGTWKGLTSVIRWATPKDARCHHHPRTDKTHT